MSHEKIAQLFECVEKLSTSDRNFASSLIAQHARRGCLSDKQWPWVDKLIERATTPQVAAVREQVGDLSQMLALFDRAAKHVKRPAIVLHIAGIGEIKLSVAGDRARVPGSINVAETVFNGRWFGRILRDGTFDVSRKCPTPAELLPALRDFAEHPAERAAEHGRLTGKCCYCNSGLKDERSTAIGYGPTCARNFGLPWGVKAAAARCEQVEMEMHAMEADADREQTIRDETSKRHARAMMENV